MDPVTAVILTLLLKEVQPLWDQANESAPEVSHVHNKALQRIPRERTNT